MFKDKITRGLVIGILSLFLVFSTVSCTALQNAFADTVITTSDNIKPESKDLVWKPGVEEIKQIPLEVRERLKADGKEIVVAYPEDLVNPEVGIEVTNPAGEGLAGILNVVGGIAGTIWPGASVLTGLGVLVSRRARGHVIEAGRQMNPFDEGYIDPKEAAISLARALGWAHSSDASKAAVESDKSVEVKVG